LFTLVRPSDEQLRSILEQEGAAPLSYPEVGASREPVLPNGYRIDRHRIELGAGMRTFVAAKNAIQMWQMFDRAWLRIFPTNAEIREGSIVAVVPSHFAFYSINLCRIVYVLDAPESARVFGFAYGTLREHAERGEERFTVSWNTDDDSVWYEILAFSKPAAFLARVGYPISRAIQRRFARASLAAMKDAVVRGVGA
jgi:uncharacterized protein (UPF0548 family)